MLMPTLEQPVTNLFSGDPSSKKKYEKVDNLFKTNTFFFCISKCIWHLLHVSLMPFYIYLVPSSTDIFFLCVSDVL